MSRINDALKRASQADRGASLPSETKSGAPPAAPERSSVFPIVLGAVVALLAAGGVWFFWRTTAVNHAAAPVPALASVPPRPAEITAPVKIEPAVAVQSPPAKTEVVPAAVPLKIAPPAFPPLKLQAIFFTPTNPRALVNGRTVGEGDEVGGARVKRIEADKVTVEWNGQSKVIEMRSP